jgi:hypothetical protein
MALHYRVDLHNLNLWLNAHDVIYMHTLFPPAIVTHLHHYCMDIAVDSHFLYHCLENPHSLWKLNDDQNK